MKNNKWSIIAILFLFVVALSANAKDNYQIEGSFDKLVGVSKFSVVVNWESLRINDLSVEEWIRFRNADQPNYDAEEELEQELKPRWRDLVSSANDKLNKKQIYLFPNDNDMDYRITIIPISCDRRGNQELLVTICKTKDGSELVRFRIKGSGGIFGTMSNLWGDGFRSSGKELSKILLKKITIK